MVIGNGSSGSYGRDRPKHLEKSCQEILNYPRDASKGHKTSFGLLSGMHKTRVRFEKALKTLIEFKS